MKIRSMGAPGDRRGYIDVEYLLILVSTVLANNFVLVRFLGLCPFMGVSNKLEGAIGMSVATLFVLTLSSVSSYLAEPLPAPTAGS